MKKKILAMMLSLTMVLNTVSVAGAAELEFTDGEVAEEVEFEKAVLEEQILEEAELFDDGAVVVEDNEASVAEVEKPSPDAKQIGESVWVEFDDENRTATISGTGPMWDFYEDGMDYNKEHKNPFANVSGEYDIVIQDGVTSIGSRTFYNIPSFKIQNVNIGKDIKRIGEFAFYQSDLREVNFPDGIEIIAQHSFSLCTKIEDIIIPDSVVEIGDGCFSNCSSLKRIKIGAGVTDIPSYCFFYCQNLEEVIMTDNVNNICENAFESCIALKTIILPNNLKMIDSYAFWKCNRLQTLEIPATVKSIGNYVFKECTSLKSILFKGNLLTQIPHEVLYGCSSLETLVVPDGITYIDEQAFDNCTGLKEITIPKTVTRIFENTFNRCFSLKLIKGYTGTDAERFANEHQIPFEALNSGETDPDPTPDPDPSDKIKVGDNVYATVNGDTLTLSGDGATWNDFNWMPYDDVENVTQIIVKNGITTLGRSMFANCPKATSIDLPNSLQNIEYEAFVGCRSLKEIVLPEGLTFLRDGVFNGCSSLERISFPSSLKRIPALVDLTDLPKLKTVNISEGIETIGMLAFGSCSALSEIELPSTIVNIEQSAFSGTAIKEFTWPDNISEIPEYAFNGCSGLEKLKLPSTITAIGEYAFSGTAIKEFIWPDNIAVIPNGIFSDCVFLKEFFVPTTVSDINHNAFNGCTNLSKITIPEEVTFIGNNVFYNCRNLVIYGRRDSKAERYANNNEITFVAGNCKVIFKENGRTVKTCYVDKGYDAEPPKLTPREGYTLSWDADYTDIQEDMIINAVWTKNDDSSTEPPIIIYPPEETKYTVTFKDRGKTIKTEKVKSGEAADIPYIDRYGYKLSWDKDFSNVTSNITVNAIWTIIEPEKVTNLTAEIISNKVSLSWDESEYAGYYKIYRKAAQDEKFVLVSRTSQTLWNDRRAKTGIEYEYKAVAVRSVGGELYTSPESDVVTVKLGAPEVGRIYTVGNLNYKVMNTSEVRVTGAAKSVASLAIPSAVSICGKSFKVTSIDHKAFYKNEDLISVRMGQYITYVGQYSFYRCPNLESVRFGKNVEVISTCAFTEGPKLGNIVLPEKVKRLGAKVFYHCPNLKTLYIKTNDLEYIGKKGLAIDRSTVIKVPSRKYSAYKKMIEDSVKFSATKIVKL